MTFNKVIIAGHLTRDPELRYTPKGTAVAGCCVAVNHTWSTPEGERREEVSFVDFDSWGKLAENLCQYKKKGEPVLVEGRLKLETWDDKETGQKRSKLKVVAENVVFLGSKPENGERRAPAQRGQRAVENPQPDAEYGAQPDPVDDVPF